MFFKHSLAVPVAKESVTTELHTICQLSSSSDVVIGNFDINRCCRGSNLSVCQIEGALVHRSPSFSSSDDFVSEALLKIYNAHFTFNIDFQSYNYAEDHGHFSYTTRRSGLSFVKIYFEI